MKIHFTSVLVFLAMSVGQSVGQSIELDCLDLEEQHNDVAMMDMDEDNKEAFVASGGLRKSDLAPSNLEAGRKEKKRGKGVGDFGCWRDPIFKGQRCCDNSKCFPALDGGANLPKNV